MHVGIDLRLWNCKDGPNRWRTARLSNISAAKVVHHGAQQAADLGAPQNGFEEYGECGEGELRGG